MRSFLVLSGVLFWAFSVQAQSSSSKSGDAVTARWQSRPAGFQIDIDVRPGFHVNEKAPNSLRIVPSETSLKPILQKPQQLRFEKRSPLKTDERAAVSVYICDDALTFCENREWTWDSAGSILKDVEGGALPPASSRRALPVIKDDFYQEALGVALQDCRAKKKRVLLLFSARWCPGCIRLEQEVWSHDRMKRTLNEFVKVKLDADRFENKSKMKEYGVAGIPAVLILNCTGEELGRVVDYLDRDEMKSVLTVLATKKLETRAELEKKAKAGDQVAILDLAQRAAQSYQLEEALRWFALIPERKTHREYWIAKTMDLDQRANTKDAAVATKKEWRDNLTAAVQAFPRTMSSLDWRLSLAKAQEAGAATATLKSLIELCDELIKNPARMTEFVASEPSGDYRGLESLRVYQAKSEALEALKKPEEALATWKAAVAEGRRLVIREEPSGPYYRFSVILKKAGEHENLKKFFARHAARSNADGELLRRYAKYLFEQGDYAQAVTVSERALRDAYGRNEILAAVVYAKSLGKAGKVHQAKQFLLKYQTRQDLAEDAREQINGAFAEL